MSVSKPKTFLKIQNTLHELGYNIYIREFGKWHRVYVGGFKSERIAHKVLRHIQKEITKDAYLVRLDVKKPLLKTPKKAPVTPIIQVIQEEEKKVIHKEEVIVIQKTQKETKRQEFTNFFIGAYYAYSKLSITQTDLAQRVNLAIDIQESATTYGAELGYYISNTIFTTLNYQKSDAKSIKFENIFATLNYNFLPLSSFSPYLGVLAGSGSINWSKNPVDGTSTSSSSASFLTGLQLGSNIKMYENLSLYIFYRYLAFEYKSVAIESNNKKEISHTAEQNINIGLKYNF